MAAALDLDLDLAGVSLHDEDDESVSDAKVLGPLDAEMRKIFGRREDLGHLASGEVWAVSATGGRGVQEHVVHVSEGGDSKEAIYVDCKVTYEEVSPTQLVQYRFDGSEEWRLSHVSLDALVAFRSGRFAAWEKRLLEPTCAAELRRMYRIGAVIRVYDHHMFPNYEEEKADFEVIDEKSGKTVIIPRPVRDLRIWNAASREYDPVQAELEGAPSVGDVDHYWGELVAKMRETWGDEEFDRMTTSEDH
jgi:hypothetical protein